MRSDLGRRLFPVSGDAKLCAPCSLSAATGTPTDAFPDAAMSLEAVVATLEGMGLRVGFLGESSYAIAKPLEEFAHPEIEKSACWWGSLSGVFLLVLNDSANRDSHLVAVYAGPVVFEGQRSRRMLADNTFRLPTGFSQVLRYKEYARYIVHEAIHISPTSDV